jgi:phosphoserine aminotransferase
VLGLPDTHRIGIVPGLGHRRLRNGDVDDARRARPSPLAWESFGEGWVTDVSKQLKLDPTVIRADYGEMPDLSQVDWSMTCCSPGTARRGRARAQCGLDRGGPAGPVLRRRDQRGVRL